VIARFREFLDALDTPGGHILVCIFMGLIGVWVCLRGHEMAAAPLLGFLGAATLAMRGNGQPTKKD